MKKRLLVWCAPMLFVRSLPVLLVPLALLACQPAAPSSLITPPSGTAPAPGAAKSPAMCAFSTTPVPLSIAGATEVVVLAHATCVVAGGTLSCAGWDFARTLQEVAPGVAHAAGWGRDVCATDARGAVVCFGKTQIDAHPWNDPGSDPTVPRAHPVQLALRSDRLAAVSSTGTLQLGDIARGSDARQQIHTYVLPMRGDVKALAPVDEITMAWSLTKPQICARSRGQVRCLGDDSDGTYPPVVGVPAPVKRIGGNCALLADDRLACFSLSAMGGTQEAKIVATIPGAESLASVDGGGAARCARTVRSCASAIRAWSMPTMASAPSRPRPRSSAGAASPRSPCQMDTPARSTATGG